MKKLLFILALAVAFLGCSKEEGHSQWEMRQNEKIVGGWASFPFGGNVITFSNDFKSTYYANNGEIIESFSYRIGRLQQYYPYMKEYSQNVFCILIDNNSQYYYMTVVIDDGEQKQLSLIRMQYNARYPDNYIRSFVSVE